MTDRERLDEEPSRVACLSDMDCSRYSMCDLANGCRCQVWGECMLVRVAGQPCHNNLQCADGLFCRDTDTPFTIRKRCFPITHLEDLPMFADLPEPDQGGPPHIPPTYEGPLLVATISISLVIVCLGFAAWCRFTHPSDDTPAEVQMPSPSSVLIDKNYIQPLPNYASTNLCAIHGCSTDQ